LDDVVAEMGGKPVAYIVKLDVRLWLNHPNIQPKAKSRDL
jgi:hypothetical protein